MKAIILASLILSLILVSGISQCSNPSTVQSNITEKECLGASDCVPASCCHATSCVAKSNAPDCSDTMCTMDCKPNTLDCGGSCTCNEGKCGAILA